MKQLKTTDGLIQGIELILSKDRCSFTNEEKALLLECKQKLLELKNAEQECDPTIAVEVVKIFLQIFSLLKDFL